MGRVRRTSGSRNRPPVATSHFQHTTATSSPSSSNSASRLAPASPPPRHHHHPRPPQELTEEQLVHVLTEPRHALCKQYAQLLAMNGARFRWGARRGAGV